MDISGIVTDSQTKKPLPGIDVQLWRNSTGKATGIHDITDIQGNYSIVDDSLSDPDVFVQAIDPTGNYMSAAGSPSFFDSATISLDPSVLVKKIPIIVWVLVVVIVLTALYLLRNKIKL